MKIRGLGTEEACLVYPPSGTRLEADCVSGGGSVKASASWLLEARANKAET